MLDTSFSTFGMNVTFSGQVVLYLSAFMNLKGLCALRRNSTSPIVGHVYYTLKQGILEHITYYIIEHITLEYIGRLV